MIIIQFIIIVFVVQWKCVRQNIYDFVFIFTSLTCCQFSFGRYCLCIGKALIQVFNNINTVTRFVNSCHKCHCILRAENED